MNSSSFKTALACTAQCGALGCSLHPGQYFGTSTEFVCNQPPIASGIFVILASYGANCKASNLGDVTDIVGSLCDGTDSCDFVASNDFFPDTAYGCYKSFTTTYICVTPGVSHPPRVTFGTGEYGSVSLTCM